MTAATTVRALSAVAALALLLTGCVAESSAGTGGAGSGASAAPTPAAQTAEDATQDADDDAEVAPSDQECIVGSWLVDNAQFGDLVSSYGDGVIDEVSGVARFMAEADGTAVTEYIEWANVVRLTDPPGTVTMVRNGRDGGTYHADPGGTFTLEETDMDSVIDVEMTAGGATMPMPTIEGSPGALHLAVFSCSGDELTVTVEDRSMTLPRER